MKRQPLAMAADQTFENHRKPTRRDEFLKTMEAIVPWAALCEVIEPYYPKAGNGRPPIGLESRCPWNCEAARLAGPAWSKPNRVKEAG
jgi:hypothetical protein